MTREEVVQLFKLLKSFYPNFDVSSEKINHWTWAMKKMDFNRVMAKAQEHVQSNKFPPTIAEIAAYAPKKNEALEKMQQWKREAEQVPPEVKKQFAYKLQKLLKDKAR